MENMTIEQEKLYYEALAKMTANMLDYYKYPEQNNTELPNVLYHDIAVTLRGLKDFYRGYNRTQMYGRFYNPSLLPILHEYGKKINPFYDLGIWVTGISKAKNRPPKTLYLFKARKAPKYFMFLGCHYLAKKRG